jgi:hypothetical protein
VRPTPVWTSSKIKTGPALAAQAAQFLKVAGRWQVDATFGLDGLGDDRAGAIADRGAGSIGVAEWDEAHVAHHGAETLRYLAWPVTDSAPMVRPWKLFLEGDELDPLGLAAHHGLVAPRQLERRLVGLGAGVAEKHLAGKGALGQGLGQADLRLDKIEVRGVVQARGLLGDGLREPLVAVPQDAHRDAGGHVEVAAPSTSHSTQPSPCDMTMGARP